jgi:hypothetical protein
MSNNMYDILGKLNSLTPKQEAAKPAQPLYESVEAKGSIVAGVKSVEQKLREQFEAMEEERETLKTKHGTIYKGGTYGNADYDSEAGGASNAPKPTRGRPAAGKERIAKVAKVRGPKGRPKKNANGPTGGNAPKGDIFGRTTGEVPKGKKGTVVKGKGNIDEAQLDELSPKTLGNYVKDAAYDAKGKGFDAGSQQGWAMSKSKEMFGGIDAGSETDEKAHKRLRGIKRATDKLVGKATEGAKNPFSIGMGQAKKEVGLGRAKKLGESRTKMLTMLSEGVNFREMLASKDQSLTELLSELQNDIKTFKETGHCSDFLRDCMEVHGYGKKQLNDAVRGDSFAPQHPGTPEPKPSFLDRAKQFGHKVLDKVGHGSDEELKAKLRRDMGMQEAAELNELARLAGLKVSEANDGNLANNAKPYDKVTQGDVVAGRLGKDEQGGKEEVEEMWGNPYDDDKVDAINAAHPPKTPSPVSSRDPERMGGPAIPAKHHTYDRKAVSSHTPGSDKAAYDQLTGREQMGEDDIEEGPEIFKLKADAAKKAGKKDFVGPDGKTYPVTESQLDECGDMSPIGGMAHEMQKQQGRISVNTNSSSDGNKSVSISADGEAAEQLMAMLKMAGLGGGQAHAQAAEIVIAHEAKEYGDTDVAEPEEYLNSPREKVAGMKQSPTTGLAGGTDDLNKSKDQDPATANKAANPKAKQEKQLEDVNPLDSLGAKLMAEYQAIKISK